MTDLIIVLAIIGVSVLFIARNVVRSFTRPASSCGCGGGCSGCGQSATGCSGCTDDKDAR